MTSPPGNQVINFCFPQISMSPFAMPQKTLRFEGNKINCFLLDQSLSTYYVPALREIFDK